MTTRTQDKTKVVPYRRALRLAAGHKDVAALAAKLAIKSASTIYMIEKEERDPSPELAKAICKEYGCTMDQIYTTGKQAEIERGEDGTYTIIREF